MSQYDLDAHVRRVLERKKRQRPVIAAKGQGRLFDTEPYCTGVPRLPRTAEGLVPDDEMLFSREVHLHSLEKARDARRYAEIVGKAMRAKWELWWLELFAGPGRLYVRETGEFRPGSPVEAVSTPYPFRGYVFTDVSLPCVECLGRRVGGPNVHVLHGDANSADVLDEITRIVPRHALVVLYADQAGLDLQWPTVKHFIDRYPHLDLLLNLPVTGVVRALAARYEGKAGALLDHEAPLELIAGAESKGASIREWYQRKLAAEGFDQIHSVTIKIRRNRELYDLLLASRHPLAARFFQAAAGDTVRRATDAG